LLACRAPRFVLRFDTAPSLPAADERRQENSESTGFAVVATERRGDFASTLSNAAGSIRANGSRQAAPCFDVAADDDVLDRGFRQLSPGLLGEVPVLHERRVERSRASLQHEADSGANPLDLRETKLFELSGFERRQRGAPDARCRRELYKRSILRAATLADENTDRAKIH
jgi:hypothetical protein